MLHVIEEHQDRVNGAGSFNGILLHSPWCINPCSNRRDHSFRVWYPINVSLHSGSHHSKYFSSAKKLSDDETFSHVQKNIWKKWRLSCMNNRSSSGLMKLWALPQGLRV